MRRETDRGTMKLNGSTVVVFGGARGMGRAFCQAFLQQGAKVYFCDIREPEGQQTQTELATEFGADHVRFKKCDATKPDEVKAVYTGVKSLFGVPDVVVNHVGIMHEGQWRLVLDVNIQTVIESTRQALEYMSKSVGGKGGVIFNTASIAAILARGSWAPVYAASKAAVVHYTRVMSTGMQYEKHGVRMMCICPAIVATDMITECLTEDKVEFFPKYKVFMENRRDQSALLQPEWVADVMIDMIDRDEEMNGVAAVMETKTPEYYYKESS